MYELVKKWYGSDCVNQGYQGRWGWFFQTPKFKRDIRHVMPSLNVITFSERKEESVEFKNMFSPRSFPLSLTRTSVVSLPPPCHPSACGLSSPPPRGTRVRACLSSTCLQSVRVLRHPCPPLGRVSGLEWQVVRCSCEVLRCDLV